MPVRAIQSFHAEGRVIGRGQVLSSRDPIVKGRDSLFETVDDATIERATQAPGEKRPTKRATKKSAKS